MSMHQQAKKTLYRILLPKQDALSVPGSMRLIAGTPIGLYSRAAIALWQQEGPAPKP